jgi:hypothetical protein
MVADSELVKEREPPASASREGQNEAGRTRCNFDRRPDRGFSVVKKRLPSTDRLVRAEARGIAEKPPVADTCSWTGCPEPHSQRQKWRALVLGHPEDDRRSVARSKVDRHPVRCFLHPKIFMAHPRALSGHKRGEMGKVRMT